MATDANVMSPSFSQDYASGTFASEAGLPEMVSVLPTASERTDTQVAYADAQPLTASSFAGSEPSADGGLASGNVFLEPEPEQTTMAAVALSPRTRPFQIKPVEGGDAELNRLIEKYALLYDVPVDFVRRVVKRESNFRPSAYNRGHWGLMQIKHATARGMGYRGPPNGLLNAETNLKYAVKYLRGAWMVADGNPDLADRLYQRGYYYDAKRKGLLDETGLGRDRVRKRRSV
jgi:hypothetical protein